MPSELSASTTAVAAAAVAAAATAAAATSPTRAIDVGVARVRPRSSTRCDTSWGDGGQHVVVEVVCEPVSATDDT